MRQEEEEEKVALDEDRTAVFGSITDTGTTCLVEARAALVLDDAIDDESNNNSTTTTPDRKLPAYYAAAQQPHSRNNSLQSAAYTTATAATTGGESFRTGPTTVIPPDAHLLTFKHQVQDFEPPSMVLSSRHIQPVDPEVALEDNNHSNDVPSCSDFDSSFSRGGFSEGVTPDERRAMEAEFQLIDNGFPDGLARHLVREVKSLYPIRFWCIDNSASMYKDDCRRFVHNDETEYFGNSGPEPTVKCTRWTELLDTVKYHAKLAGITGATTVFRLLNHYSNAPEEYVVNRESDTRRVMQILEEIQPDGVSLLTQHVSSVSERIQSIEHNLRQQGQKAVVVLATDGLPSDQFGESTRAMQDDFIIALKQLQLMPVWIVIRLCTTDREVLNFYRHLDKELERPVDVIGGFLTEAKEVARLNKWLNYAMPLHRAREMGLSSRLPDLLDERQLTKDEFREMVELLFDKDSLEEAPNVHTDWPAFVKFLQEHVLPRMGRPWNPETKRVEYWIDCGKLKTAYGAGLRHKKDMLVLGMQRAFSKDVI